jgi:hypothetical protein
MAFSSIDSTTLSVDNLCTDTLASTNRFCDSLKPEKMSTTTTAPSQEEIDELLLSCRYGDLEDVQAFVEKFGDEALAQAKDDRGNNVVHMCCGNGHVGECDERCRVIWKPGRLTDMNARRGPSIHLAPHSFIFVDGTE